MKLIIEKARMWIFRIRNSKKCVQKDDYQNHRKTFSTSLVILLCFFGNLVFIPLAAQFPNITWRLKLFRLIYSGTSKKWCLVRIQIDDETAYRIRNE